MKKIITALLLICMVFCLCACGDTSAPTTEPQGTEPQGTTAPQLTAPQPTDPEPTEPQGTTYTIKVVDEGGNPVAGAMVQLCAEVCIPRVTDAEGNAVFENQEERDDYKASVTAYPAGYEALGEQTDFYFDGTYEVTITVKAVA